MTIPHRIQRLLDDRTLEAVEPDSEKIATLWAKAVASNSDSRKGLSADNAITLAYQAGLQACTALLEARGYRTKGASGGHHQRTFYAAAARGYEKLSDVDIASERVRKQRTKSFYGAAQQDETDAERLHAWLDALLPAVYEALGKAAPAVHRDLTQP
jgi:hypothetical protein